MSDPVDKVVRRVRTWRSNISLYLLLSDAIVITVVVFSTQIGWLGSDARFMEEGPPYWLISAAIIAAWTWALSLNDSRSPRVLGSGWNEYLRIISGSFRLFGAIAIIAYLAMADIARGFVLLSLPLGVAALLVSRMLWRAWLNHRRRSGRFLARTLLVGSPATVSRLAQELSRASYAGFMTVGACLPPSAIPELSEHSGTAGIVVPDTQVPVVGSFNDVIEAMHRLQADTVVIAGADELSAEEIKRISWAMEVGRQHLVLAPGIMDIAGPRMHIRPVAGLPLIHVETPTFSRGQRFTKRSFDLIVSILGIIVLSPLLALVALLVRATSPGPAFFSQERVGRSGRIFRMVKFRSMGTDAEQRREALQAQQAELGNEVLFKLRDDPRVTRVGRFIRRYSIDELPQLFNVLTGSMSLIGPRPPLCAEVEKYAAHVHRRFLMKPGITGPWQVSGRSALSWDESVRIDLSYVENWSLANDILILAKTVGVVLAPGDTAH